MPAVCSTRSSVWCGEASVDSAGDGRQFVSWIHHEDFVRAVRWLMTHEDVAGAVNVAAPHPLPNAEFMRVLRAAAGAAVGLPASRWMLEIGAVFMRTETELVLKSRRVVPGGCSRAASRSPSRDGRMPRAISSSTGGSRWPHRRTVPI